MGKPDIEVVIGGQNTDYVKKLGEITPRAQKAVKGVERTFLKHKKTIEKMESDFVKRRAMREKAAFELSLRQKKIDRARIRGQKEAAAASQIQLNYERDLMNINKQRWITDKQRARLRDSAFATKEAETEAQTARIANELQIKRTRVAKAEGDKRARLHAANMAKMQKAMAIGAAGMAASIAIIGKAWSAAAEKNADIRESLERFEKQRNRLLVELGEDYGGSDAAADFVGGLATGIRFSRNTISDVYRFALNPLDRTRAADLDAERDDAKAAEQARKLQLQQRDQRDQAIIGLGGADGETKDAQLRLRRFNESISKLGIAEQARLRGLRAAKLAAEKAKEAEDKFNEAQKKRLDTELKLANAVANADPNNFDAKRRAEDARVAQDRFNGVDSDLIDIESADRRKQIDESEAEFRKNEEREERKRVATAKQIDLEIRQSEIAQERLDGRDKEADRLQTLLDFEKKILDIKERAGITDKQRQRLLDAAANTRDAQVKALERVQRTDRASSPSITAGLGGAGTVLDRVFGVNRTGSQASDPLVANTTKANELLQGIKDAVTNPTTAVLGA